MNAKTLLISLTILTILTFSVQSIRIGNSHKVQRQMAHNLVTRVSHTAFKFGFPHKSSKFLHLGAAAAPEIPPSVVQGLMNLVMGDKQMMDSIMNEKPLSQGSIDKIKDFFVKNKEFNDAMVQSFDKDPKFPQCYKDMKPNQKKKFVTIIIQSMDFAPILNGEETKQPTQADIDNIKKSINSDKQLGPDAVKCLGGSLDTPSRS